MTAYGGPGAGSDASRPAASGGPGLARWADPAMVRRLQAFLADEGLSLNLEDIWVDRRQRLSSLGYVQTADSILLLRRKREPFTGYWTAPGGKLREGESPRDALLRELYEETQLRVEEAHLRLIASETGPDHYCWLLFGFAVYGWSGVLGRTEEGQLAWVRKDRLDQVQIPEVDRAVLPCLLEPHRGQVYLARIRYGEGGSLQSLELEMLERRFP